MYTAYDRIEQEIIHESFFKDKQFLNYFKECIQNHFQQWQHQFSFLVHDTILPIYKACLDKIEQLFNRRFEYRSKLELFCPAEYQLTFEHLLHYEFSIYSSTIQLEKNQMMDYLANGMEYYLRHCISTPLPLFFSREQLILFIRYCLLSNSFSNLFQFASLRFVPQHFEHIFLLHPLHQEFPKISSSLLRIKMKIQFMEQQISFLVLNLFYMTVHLANWFPHPFFKTSVVACRNLFTTTTISKHNLYSINSTHLSNKSFTWKWMYRQYLFVATVKQLFFSSSFLENKFETKKEKWDQLSIQLTEQWMRFSSVEQFQKWYSQFYPSKELLYLVKKSLYQCIIYVQLHKLALLKRDEFVQPKEEQETVFSLFETSLVLRHYTCKRQLLLQKVKLKILFHSQIIRWIIYYRNLWQKLVSKVPIQLLQIVSKSVVHIIDPSQMQQLLSPLENSLLEQLCRTILKQSKQKALETLYFDKKWERFVDKFKETFVIIKLNETETEPQNEALQLIAALRFALNHNVVPKKKLKLVISLIDILSEIHYKRKEQGLYSISKADIRVEAKNLLERYTWDQIKSYQLPRLLKPFRQYENSYLFYNPFEQVANKLSTLQQLFHSLVESHSAKEIVPIIRSIYSYVYNYQLPVVQMPKQRVQTQVVKQGKAVEVIPTKRIAITNRNTDTFVLNDDPLSKENVQENSTQPGMTAPVVEKHDVSSYNFFKLKQVSLEAKLENQIYNANYERMQQENITKPLSVSQVIQENMVFKQRKRSLL